ncbi:MAG: hypothetical protein V4550_12310 [Gemmatimonadota bacterium]
MLRRLLLSLAVPVSGLAAQSQPLHITITAPNNASFYVTRTGDSPSHSMIGRLKWEIMSDSGTVGSMQVTALDTTASVHVEARENGRLVASADGRYVTIRRDTGMVTIEARSRAPSSAPVDARKVTSP